MPFKTNEEMIECRSTQTVPLITPLDNLSSDSGPPSWVGNIGAQSWPCIRSLRISTGLGLEELGKGCIESLRRNMALLAKRGEPLSSRIPPSLSLVTLT